MKILLCHHYWDETGGARWRPEPFPIPEIAADVQKSYTVLKEERPGWTKFGRYTAFMDYRPGTDDSGRPFVAISFAFVPDCSNPESAAKIVAPALAAADPSTFSLNLPISPAGGGGKKIILLGIGIIILLAAGFFYFIFSGSGGNIRTTNLPEKVAINNQHAPVAIPDTTNREITAGSKQDKEMQFVCANLKLMRKCPAGYLEEFYCKTGSEIIPPYATWVREKPECARSEISAANIFRGEPDKRLWNIVRILFAKKR